MIVIVTSIQMCRNDYLKPIAPQLLRQPDTNFMCLFCGNFAFPEGLIAMVTHSAFAGLSPEIVDSCKFFAGIIGSSAVDTRHIADFFLLQFLRTVLVYHATVLVDLMQAALILQSSLFDCLFWIFNVHFYSPDRSSSACDCPDRCSCHVFTVLSFL